MKLSKGLERAKKIVSTITAPKYVEWPAYLAIAAGTLAMMGINDTKVSKREEACHHAAQGHPTHWNDLVTLPSGNLVPIVDIDGAVLRCQEATMGKPKASLIALRENFAYSLMGTATTSKTLVPLGVVQDAEKITGVAK